MNNIFLRRDDANPASGDLNMDNNKIVNVGAPTSDNDCVAKKYVDQTKVGKSGETMNGNLIFKIGSSRGISVGCNDLRGDKKFNLLLGTTGDLISNQIAQPVVLQTSNGFLVKIGPNDLTTVDTVGLNMNGKKISNVGTPTEDNDVTNKKYVDSLVPIGSIESFLRRDGTLAMTGDLKLGGHKITQLAIPVMDFDVANGQYVDLATTEIFNELLTLNS